MPRCGCRVTNMETDDKTHNYVDGTVAMYHAGQISLARLGRKLAQARSHQAKVTAAARAVAALAVADGTSEVVAARELGIDRGTLRIWLGKPGK
jgi:2-methylaconitate cis-trans-isomerase PrpF